MGLNVDINLVDIDWDLLIDAEVNAKNEDYDLWIQIVSTPGYELDAYDEEILASLISKIKEI